ncbi:MAG: septal ring lytic transglycosylase RlpA family protein [Fidelibacterota bacterium]
MCINSSPKTLHRIGVIALSAIVLAACSTAPRYTQGTKHRRTNPSKSGSVRRPGARVMTGVSSYYGKDFHGKLTANGEVFDMYGLTAAHKTLPLNTIARVTNLDNGNSIILRINDRGPYVKGRILDCSYGAAVKLGFVNQGTARVRIEVIEWGDNQYMKHQDE